MAKECTRTLLVHVIFDPVKLDSTVHFTISPNQEEEEEVEEVVVVEEGEAVEMAEVVA